MHMLNKNLISLYMYHHLQILYKKGVKNLCITVSDATDQLENSYYNSH